MPSAELSLLDSTHLPGGRARELTKPPGREEPHTTTMINAQIFRLLDQIAAGLDREAQMSDEEREAKREEILAWFRPLHARLQAASSRRASTCRRRQSSISALTVSMRSTPRGSGPAGVPRSCHSRKTASHDVGDAASPAHAFGPHMRAEVDVVVPHPGVL